MTGNDVARLLRTLDAHTIQHATVETGLPEPAKWDPDTRTIYVDGRLSVDDYYAALTRVLGEVTGDNVHVLPLHRAPSRRTS